MAIVKPRAWVLCLLVLVLLAPSASVADSVDDLVADRLPVSKPDGPILRNFVRIDVAGDATASGFSGAVPVMFLPLRITTEDRMKKFESRFGLPPEGYEFDNPRGLWELVSEDGLPAQAYELVIVPSIAPLLKGVLKGANPSVYADLSLESLVDSLGVCGLGIAGDDISSLLRLPFRSSPTQQTVQDLNILFVTPLTSPDEGSFCLGNVEMSLVKEMNRMGLGSAVYPEYVDEFLTAPYKEEISAADPDYRAAVEALYEKVFTRDDDVTLKVDLICGTAPPITVDLSSNTGVAPATGTARFKLDYWPRAERSGFMTISSLSEPDMEDHSTRVYLTALSIYDAGVASLSLGREMVRALRTQLLFFGTDGLNLPGRDDIKIPLVESLKRMPLPLVEYLATNNALQMKTGLDRYMKVPDIAYGSSGRLSTCFYSELIPILSAPPAARKESWDLDDCYEDCYFHACNDVVDNLYAATVYASWRQWKKWKESDRVSDSLVEKVAGLIAAGYCREAAPAGTISDRRKALATAYLGLGSNQTLAGVGATAEAIEPRYSDLDWLLVNVDPRTDTGATIGRVAAREMLKAPLCWPLLPISKSLAGEKLRALLKDDYAGSGIKGIKSISGFPFPDLEGKKVLVADPQTTRLCQGLVRQIFTEGRSKMSKEYSYATTFVSDPFAAVEAQHYLRHPENKNYKEDIQRSRWVVWEQNRRNVEDLLDQLEKLPVEQQVGLVMVRKNPSYTKLLDLQAVASNGASAPTTAANIFCDLVEPVCRMIDAAFFTKPYDVENNPKKKSRFIRRLADKCLLSGRMVPKALLSRYLLHSEVVGDGNKEDRRRLLTRLRLAARAVGVTDFICKDASGQEVTR